MTTAVVRWRAAALVLACAGVAGACSGKARFGPTACVPGAHRPCLVDNGAGEQICDADGEWLPCAAAECEPGFQLAPDGLGCTEESGCEPDSKRYCDVERGIGQQHCHAGAGWTACLVVACDTGYVIKDNQCAEWSSHCTPGASQPCGVVADGRLFSQCQSDGSWGPCDRLECSPGFAPAVDGLSCVPLPACATGETALCAEGCGKMTCKSGAWDTSGCSSPNRCGQCAPEPACCAGETTACTSGCGLMSCSGGNWDVSGCRWPHCDTGTITYTGPGGSTWTHTVTLEAFDGATATFSTTSTSYNEGLTPSLSTFPEVTVVRPVLPGANACLIVGSETRESATTFYEVVLQACFDQIGALQWAVTFTHKADSTPLSGGATTPGTWSASHGTMTIQI